MKKLIILLAVAFLGCGQQAVTIPPYEREVLKRTEIQLLSLQQRYNLESQPIIKEHDDIVIMWCAKAGLTAVPGGNGNCDVNVQTGAVTRKVPGMTKEGPIAVPPPGKK